MGKLTRTAIDAAQPRARRYWLWDARTTGLGVLVLPSGRKSWCLRYRTAGGRPRQLVLGGLELTPDQARELAAERLREVRQGQDPAHARRAARQAPTVEALFDGYLDHMTASGRRSVATVRKELDKAADVLGRRTPAAEVTPADVSDLLGAIYRRGSRVMADRTRAYLHAAFQWGAGAEHDYRAAGRRQWGIRSNPVALVPRDTGALRPRDRALSPAELRAVWLALERPGLAPTTALAVRLLLTCGQRVRETLRARVEDFDLEAGLWTLPAATTKGWRPHRLPLPPQAVDALRPAVAARGAGPLFPGRAGDLLTEGAVNRALRRLAEREGLTRFQSRDLRRTWKSRAGDAGVDRFTRDLIQQHALTDTGSKHYDRFDATPQMRAGMARWGAWLDGVLTGAPGKVVRLK